MGINLAVSTVNYWNKYSKFIEDWQFTLTWKDQKRKFFTSEGLRLDSNNLRLNWTHAWSGALYYNWARTNRFSPLASFLFSFGRLPLLGVRRRMARGRLDQRHGLHLGRRPGHRRTPVPDRRPFPQPSRLGQPHRLPAGRSGRWGSTIFIDGKNRGPRLPTRDWSDFRFSLGGKQGPVSPGGQCLRPCGFRPRPAPGHPARLRPARFRLGLFAAADRQRVPDRLQLQ